MSPSCVGARANREFRRDIKDRVRQSFIQCLSDRTVSQSKKMIRQSVILLALVLCSVSAIQPGCRTRYEGRMKWAVQSDNTAWWDCIRWGVAVRRTCPSGTLFSAPWQTCVPARHWEEFPFHAPPTTVDDWENECVEGPMECINHCIEPVECEGGVIVDDQCVCPDGHLWWQGECIPCGGGEIVDGQCVCPPAFPHLVDGVCTSTGQIEECENNETWDPIENRCVCKEGHQWINGHCIATTGICDGAPDSAYVPGTMDCSPLECTQEQYERGTLYPTSNPRSFWQCAGYNWLHEMPCGAGTCFSFAHQVCIHARDWVNQCL